MTELAAYRGAGDTGVNGLKITEVWVGRPLPRALDFIRWDTWDNTQPQSPQSIIQWMAPIWGKQPRRMAFGLNMTDNRGTASLAQIAAGAHDDAFLLIAKALVSKGLGGSTIRLGWEANGSWYPWYAAKDPTSFKAAWVRIVGIFRGVSGSAFRWCFNPGNGQLGIAPPSFYPGDAYVDEIGVDCYCEWWSPTTQPLLAQDGTDMHAQARWDLLRTQPYGLDWAASFARAHGKALCIPEWGTGTRPDGHGAGDDPVFIANMWSWLAVNGAAWCGYWDYDAPDYKARLSAGVQPKASAAFLQAYLAGHPATEPGPDAPPLDPDMIELATLRAAAPVLQAKVDALTAQVAKLGADLSDADEEVRSTRAKIAAFIAALVGLQA